MKNNSLTFAGRIQSALRNTARIGMREMQLILSDVGIIVVVFAVPILYPLLYSLIYYPEVVRELPVAVVDNSNSSDSRQFIRNLNATPEVKVETQTLSMHEAIELFKQRKVRGIVEIPASFAADIALHRQTTVSAYADMEFFLYYKTVVTGVSFVTLDANKNIEIANLTQNGLTAQQSEIVSEPIKLVDNPLSNTGGGFASYGVPAALILIIQQTLVLAIGIMAGTARERHKYGTLIPFDNERRGTLRMVVGKSSAYFFIYALLCVYMLGMIPKWFGYAQVADINELVALMIPFLLSTIFFGITLSVTFMNRQSAMMTYLVVSIPLLFLSGIIWPLSNFSPLWLLVREIFPSSNAMFGFIKMNSLGASIAETGKEITALWIQTGVYFLTACLVYHYQVKYSERMQEKLQLI